MKRTLVVLLALAAVTSCRSAEPEVAVNLQALETCGDVEAHLRASALQEMNKRIDEAKESALQSWGCFRDLEGDYTAGAGGPPQPAPTSDGNAAGPAGPSGDGPSEYTGTNNQVAGVDEADFVKTDGRFIYLVSGDQFLVIRSWPAAETAELARMTVAGTPRKLFVYGDRALIYSSLPPSEENPPTGGDYASPGMIAPQYGGYEECTYGYNCRFTGDGNPTQITVLDLSDRSAPQVIREIKFSSSYLNARRIENAVHTVLNHPGVRFTGLRYYPPGLSCDAFPWDIAEAYENLRAENARIIRETPMENWVPSIQDTVWMGGQPQTTSGTALDCRGFYAAAINDGSSFTTLVSLDINAETPLAVSTIVSRPGAVYASKEALYMSVPHERGYGGGWYREMSDVREASTVHKFKLHGEPVGSEYVASGVVKGKVLNQFAMDEHDGHLRIATTTGRVPQPDVHSTMTVLRQQGIHLKTTGKVDGLAPKEDIRSVRFVGTRGYVVTFKKTDPLFVFDLSNPEEPRVEAELKIPGFSTYMHPMDDKHLLTIGYDADDQGSFAWFTGVLLQIFDVSDPQNPLLLHREVIGTRGSSSEALTNHLAFTYMESKNLLALPMTICADSGGGGSYGTTMTFSGLIVYDVTADAGFTERGRVPHLEGEASCHNWWTDATSVVKRSIIMDDFVFSISQAYLKVNALDDLPTDLVRLSLP